MHGFLNVFVGALLLRHHDIPIYDLVSLLDESDPDAFVDERGRVGWQDLWLDSAEVEANRAAFAHSFGSCSFEEPIDDLTKAKLL